MKNRLEQQQEQSAGTQADQRAGRQDFASPEEMLRADRDQTGVPPGVEERLTRTVAQEAPPAPAKSWWQRLLG
jgi:hypothetical protein